MTKRVELELDDPLIKKKNNKLIKSICNYMYKLSCSHIFIYTILYKNNTNKNVSIHF